MKTLIEIITGRKRETPKQVSIHEGQPANTVETQEEEYMQTKRRLAQREIDSYKKSKKLLEGLNLSHLAFYYSELGKGNIADALEKHQNNLRSNQDFMDPTTAYDSLCYKGFLSRLFPEEDIRLNEIKIRMKELYGQKEKYALKIIELTEEKEVLEEKMTEFLSHFVKHIRLVNCKGMLVPEFNREYGLMKKERNISKEDYKRMHSTYRRTQYEISQKSKGVNN